MSGETKQAISGWTVDVLHEHLREMMHAMDRRIQEEMECEQVRINERFESVKEAVTKAENATERRFESVNEFRNTLADQARELVSRNEFSTKVDAMNVRLTDLLTRMDRREGTGTGRKDMWGWVVGAVGFALALLSIIGMVVKFSGTVPP